MDWKTVIQFRPLDMDSIGGAAGNSKVYSIWTKIFDKGGW